MDNEFCKGKSIEIPFLFKDIIFPEISVSRKTTYIEKTAIVSDCTLDINIFYNKKNDLIFYGSITANYSIKDLYINIIEPIIINNTLLYKLLKKEKIFVTGKYIISTPYSNKNIVLLVTKK